MQKAILWMLIVYGCQTLSAQTETLTGKLVKKAWTKTVESYCAGGSDYYVLMSNDKTEAILDLSRWRKRKINKNLNKNVTLKGNWQSDTKQNDDPLSQHPTTPTLCRKFVVMK